MNSGISKFERSIVRDMKRVDRVVREGWDDIRDGGSV